MLKQLKKFIEGEYENAKKFANTPAEVVNYRAMCFGALWFCQIENYVNYSDIDDYWNNNMLNKFNQLAIDKQQ